MRQVTQAAANGKVPVGHKEKKFFPRVLLEDQRGCEASSVGGIQTSPGHSPKPHDAALH